MDRNTIEAVVQGYIAVLNMHRRCTPGTACAKRYGDRGITVCAAWGDPMEFIRWALFEGGFALGLSIDRIDNDKNYCPENCHWVTQREQNRNQGRTKLDWDKVERIRAIDDIGNMYQREVGKFFEVGGHLISDIRTGKKWKVLEQIDRPVWQVTDEEILNVMRLYGISVLMKNRTQPNHRDHQYYHDKGITVCKKWVDDFVMFVNWALSHNYSDDRSIDRINNDKGYYPENCRWATDEEQLQNQSTNIFNPGLVRQVREICAQTDLVDREIAEIYGASESTIGSIKNRSSWKNI